MHNFTSLKILINRRPVNSCMDIIKPSIFVYRSVNRFKRPLPAESKEAK